MKKIQFIVNVAIAIVTLITSGCSITVGRSAGRANAGGGVRNVQRTVPASEAALIQADPKMYNGVDNAKAYAAEQGWTRPQYRFDISKGGEDLNWMDEARAFAVQSGFHAKQPYSGDVFVRESAHTITEQVPVEGGAEGSLTVRGGDINASGAVESFFGFAGKVVDVGGRALGAYMHGSGMRRVSYERRHVHVCHDCHKVHRSGYCPKGHDRRVSRRVDHDRGRHVQRQPDRTEIVNRTKVRVHNVTRDTAYLQNGRGSKHSSQSSYRDSHGAPIKGVRRAK